jgi:cyclopropane fatty-acyl-phospholipid synthase-like methyltransferase
MLAPTCEPARLANGDRILELGRGWGSPSLWMVANYPDARITAVSHSRTQKGSTSTARRGGAACAISRCSPAT